MYNNILVAVDGSETANRALAEAAKLAKEQHAMMRLLHVAEELPPYMVAEMPFPLDDYKKLMRDGGKALLAKCADNIKGSGITFDTKYAAIDSFATRTCDVINEEARTWPADLIVIGTHGRRGVNRLLLGSVAETVIRTASMPVLIIRGQ